MLRPFRAFESVETTVHVHGLEIGGWGSKTANLSFSASQLASALELELSVKFYSVGKFFQKQ